MDEGSKHQQSMESGQQNQRQVNHPRPFFYVQPASQPYYNMYHHHNQWHNMNNPYNHYGLPGSGVSPFGRPSPYMSAYPYMQYPGGYVVPHAPHMHPVDYRRMYEPPHFHLPPVHDPIFRQQQQHHHDHTQREVVCSEAQTDPSDALNKLIECLDKLRANEMQGSEKELDSGVVSQSSGISSPDGERKSCEVVVGGDIHSGHGASCVKLEGSQLQSSFPMGRLFSVGNSTTAVYDCESSRRLGSLGKESWAVDSDEDTPLDSSSIHEENLDLQQHVEESLHRCSLESLCLQSAVLQSEDSPRPENIDNDAEEDSTNPDGTSSTEVPRWQGHCSNLLSTQSLPSPLASDWQALEDTKCGEETFDVPDRKGLSKLDVDLSYQILHLPFDKVLTAGALQKDCSASSSSALLCGDLQASLSSSRITTTSTPARHHYYSYYCPPQTAHGRLSVLSPSLDELSSREEMFSTDLEDMDRFPRSSVYAGRRFPAEVEHLREPGVKKVCPKSNKLLCACCGSSLLKGGASRVKVHHSPRVYADDEAGDSDDLVEQEQQSARTRDESAHPTRVVVQKHSVPKKHQPLHIQQHPKPSCKRGQCREAVGPEEKEKQEEPEMVLERSELEYYEGHVAEGGQDAGDKEHRTCKDGLCREGIETSEPGRWERGRAKPRRKPHASLQERLALRKALWKPLVYQRVRDEEEEPTRCHRGKDMETTASTAQHAFGAGPHGPNPAHGPQPGQGPRHPGHPGPYGVPRPEDQPPHQQHQQPHHHIQHSRPFFYIHPSQPYPSQPYPSQPYASQPYASQPYASQPFPSQPFPSQPFPSQPFPSQPFPSQPFPSQPFPSQLYPSALPYQWPMPYNPYCGFPGMGGYGMMIPSPFQPSPYMEPPGYILPHSQLHLADYRRMINPHYHTTHYPQTMAYHARRFRYQHNAPATSREMINSEVQTEPTLGAARSDPKLSNADSSMKSNVQTNSESGSDTSCTAAQSLSPASAVQEVMSKSPAYQDIVLAPTPNNTPISTRSAAPQKGSFVFQTEVEELRLECRSTPTGLNILHSHETSELCTAHSVSATDEDLVQLCSSSSLHHHKVSQGRMLHGQEGMGLVGEEGDQCLQQACTDILLMDGACSSGGPDNFLALDDCDSFIAKTLAERPGNSESDMDYRVVVQSHTADGPQFTSDDGELSSKSVYFKILHLPFDMQYLEELRKIEASVWSASLAPYVPSAEFMIQQGLMEPHREALSPVVMEEVPMVEEVPTAEVVPMVEVEVPGAEKVPTAEVVSLVEGVPIVESPSNENVLLAEMVPNVVEVPAISSPNKTDNAPMSPETSQKRGAVSDLDHQDTAFEGLPMYRPSSSWLGDFGNVYYHSKMPSDVQEQRKILRGSPLKVSSPKRKPNHDQEPHCVSVTTTAPLRLKGEGCRPGDKVDRRSYSDQEFCANRTFNVNTVTSGGHKRERICARCLTTKCRVNKRPGSPGPGLDAPIVKRQGVPIPPWEEYILAQTCAACKCLARRRVTRKGSGSDVPSGPQNEETEGETSENSSCRAGPGPKLRDPRRPQSSMKRHSEKCPMGPHSKLREKNCSCEEPHRPPAAGLGGPRRHPHGDVIRERNEENLGVCVSVPLQDKWRNQHQDQCYLAAQKSQQEKLWKAALSNPDNTESNIKLGPRDLIKQKKHISQSQGLHRKDTRC